MYMDHGESVFKLIPPREVPEPKPPMHRSLHYADVPPTGSTFGQFGTSHAVATNLAGDASEFPVPLRSARTMGKAPGSYTPRTSEFLKKSTNLGGPVMSLSQVQKEAAHLLKPNNLKPKLRPDVPRADMAPPIMNLVTSKNFVVANAVEVILAAPKKVHQGNKDYLSKEDFGAVPAYLKRIKADIASEYAYLKKMQDQADEANRSQVRAMDHDERLSLIDGLKARWEQVNTQYQATTHLTKLDTVGKLRRKEKFEAELSQIEKDIEKLNRKNLLIDHMG